ncbi:hypothetical protein [Sphingomonas rubra]|uniref:Uncharacterized protein n=1 Tax=Sphingomonas rubra TaxID=634430 RepID=A0A1I5TUY9_9SPHN|nr:hypothetical protein [Sphingomonas rubra]SFP86892.1 hypothetical protein SAMN04488241_10978 [Sphingomonas rubra]
MRRVFAAMAALLLGIAYWWAVGRSSGVAEPWDAPSYWSVGYPGALVLAALLGWWWPRRAWALGAIVVLAQLPVVIASSGVGPLLALGALYAGVLALPAMAVAALAGRIRARGGR